MDKLALWRRYKQYLCECPSVGMKLDISRMNFDNGFLGRLEPRMAEAYRAMADLEAGQIANPDEQRMVGHYWLRAPGLAPNDQIINLIEQTNNDIRQFVTAVHNKQITPPSAARFTDAVVVGIGGSALGPQLVADALGTKRDKMQIHFVDNTDPDGIDRVVALVIHRRPPSLPAACPNR